MSERGSHFSMTDVMFPSPPPPLFISLLLAWTHGISILFSGLEVTPVLKYLGAEIIPDLAK